MSRLKKIVHEIDRRSLWPVPAGAGRGSLLACARFLAFTPIGRGRGDDQAKAERSTITVLYCCCQAA